MTTHPSLATQLFNTSVTELSDGGGEYTGFNATANENISVTSASANDVGSLVSSGSATGGVIVSIDGTFHIILQKNIMV